MLVGCLVVVCLSVLCVCGLSSFFFVWLRVFVFVCCVCLRVVRVLLRIVSCSCAIVCCMCLLVLALCERVCVFVLYDLFCMCHVFFFACLCVSVKGSLVFLCCVLYVGV